MARLSALGWDNAASFLGDFGGLPSRCQVTLTSRATVLPIVGISLNGNAQIPDAGAAAGLYVNGAVPVSRVVVAGEDAICLEGQHGHVELPEPAAADLGPFILE